MYKLNEDQKDFLTDEYLPVSTAYKDGNEVTDLQLEVQTKAVDGGIYRVEITNGGASYPNAIPSEKSPRLSSEIGSSTIHVPDDLSTVADTYNGFIFYISSGPGVGTYRRITDYVIGDEGKELTLETPIDQRVIGTSESSENASQV